MSTGRLYWADEAPPRIPAGSYEILRALAVGTIGETDLARAHGEAGFIKPVVIKRLRPELGTRADFRDVLVQDTKLAVRLRAPTIVSVLDLGRDGDELYVSMEFVAGASMSAWLDARTHRGLRPLPHAVAAFVTHQILEALEAAHEVGLTHGDLSARRILLSLEGDVKLGGLGLTRCARLVESGAAVAADVADDLAGVGNLLYEMTSLRTVLSGQATPLPLAKHEDLDAFLRRAMLPGLSRRFASATEMRATLASTLSEMVKEGRRILRTLLREDMPDALAEAENDLRRASLDERADGNDERSGSFLPRSRSTPVP